MKIPLVILIKFYSLKNVLLQQQDCCCYGMKQIGMVVVSAILSEAMFVTFKGKLQLTLPTVLAILRKFVDTLSAVSAVHCRTIKPKFDAKPCDSCGAAPWLGSMGQRMASTAHANR